MPAKRGFTLIEILVVLLIIGIISGAALLAFGDFGARRKAIVNAEQFIAYVKLVQQKSILEMTTHGIKIDPNGYGTLKYDNENWQSLGNSNIFHWQAFPSSIKVNVFNVKSQGKYPAIIISSTGNMTPFKLTFGTNTEQVAILLGQPNGELTLQSAKP